MGEIIPPISRRDTLKLLSLGAGAWFLASCSTAPPGDPATPTAVQPRVTETPVPTNQPAVHTASATETSAPNPTALPDINGLRKLPLDYEAGRITPVGDFYVQNSNGLAKPDSFSWRLSLNGSFDQPMELSLVDIRKRPRIEAARTLECIGNPVGGNLIGNASWVGISLSALLQEAGLQAEANYLLFYSEDEYETSIPVSLGLNEDSLLVYEMNGEALTVDHGSPLRVLLPGVYGQKQPKWITSIRASERDQQGTWEKKGWSNEATIQINSKIETPRLRQNIPAGVPFYITGIAMSDSSGIGTVEVSIDDGETWQPAQLDRGANAGVWTLWNWVWEDPLPGKHILSVRALDGNGIQQGESGTFGVLDNVFPNGTSLVHNLSVTVAV